MKNMHDYTTAWISCLKKKKKKVFIKSKEDPSLGISWPDFHFCAWTPL